jgi:YYY domain-containing protein
MPEIAAYWLAAALLGLLALPASFWLLSRLPGRGLLFARPLGLLIAAYVLWIGASAGIWRADRAGALISAAVLALLSAWTLRRAQIRADLLQALRANRGRLLLSELLFGLGFAAWAAVRAFSADKIMPSGGEKFMEIAFLNSVLNTPRFPPLDPWLSGYSISYYYFGYVQMGLLTRLSALPSTVAFELHNALLFAFALQLPLALVSEMALLSSFSRARAIFSGLCAALFTAGMGNLQGLLEALHARGWLPAASAAWLALPDFPPAAAAGGTFYPGHASWWWWRASRVLSDLDFSGRPLPISPITEFPFFSFLLGDNHPHVLALPTALLAGALALDWAARGSLRGASRGEQLSRLLAAALVTGALLFLNTWDFPIYLGLVLLALAAGMYARQGGLARRDWLEIAWRAGLLCTTAAVLYLPFLLSFSSQAGGLLPYVFPPTRLAQYLVMFAPFIFILAVFLPTAIRHASHGAANPFTARRAAVWWLRLALGLAAFFILLVGSGMLILVLDQLSGGVAAQTAQSWLGGGSMGAQVLRILAARTANPWLFLTLSLLITLSAALLTAAPRKDAASPDLGLLFAALLAFAGLALTFSVEFLYLRDGFGVRMNTVFKFYFQGWVLLACASAYAAGWIADRLRPAARGLFFTAAALLTAAGLVYPILAVPARTREFTTPWSLDGASNLRVANPADWAAIDWLSAQPRPAGRLPVLLEAPCPSYCSAGRISAFTGFPAILGWSAHETQWRGSSREQNQRLAEIIAIYTTAGAQEVGEQLAAWQVDYVILGDEERQFINRQCAQAAESCDPQTAEKRLDGILTPLFRSGGTTIYAVPR